MASVRLRTIICTSAFLLFFWAFLEKNEDNKGSDDRPYLLYLAFEKV